jgi:hypothetical protein
MKKCRYCGEEIQDNAITCGYCSKFLSKTPQVEKNEEYSRLEISQAITFMVGLFALFVLGFDHTFIFVMGAWSWILFGLFLIPIGLWIYAVIYLGFRKSFHFLGLLLELLAHSKGRRGG